MKINSLCQFIILSLFAITVFYCIGISVKMNSFLHVPLYQLVLLCFQTKNHFIVKNVIFFSMGLKLDSLSL